MGFAFRNEPHFLYIRQGGLQFFSGQFRQFRAFSLYKVYKFEKFLSVQLFGKMRKAVRPSVQVWLVYLLNIAGKYHLSPLSGSCDYGFYLVRGKVLCLVYDEKDIGKASAPYICQRRNDQFVIS